MFQKGHECKATHRLSEPVFLKFGPCRSRKRFRPKYCGICPIPGMDCKPTLSTTVNVDFICEGKYTKPTETKSNIYELTGTWKFISVPGRFNLLQSVQITASCQKKPITASTLARHSFGAINPFPIYLRTSNIVLGRP